MGNSKSSVSEGEEDDDRSAPLKPAKSLGMCASALVISEFCVIFSMM